MALLHTQSGRLSQLLARASRLICNENGARSLPRYLSHWSRMPIFPSYSGQEGDQNKNLNVEVVDCDTWNVFSGISQSWRKPEVPVLVPEEDAGMVGNKETESEDLDLEDIEDMRYRRNLFYKIDRNSREFEEYSFDFHRRKSLKGKAKGKEKPTAKISQFGRSKHEKSQNNLLEVKADAYPPLLKDEESTSVVKKRTRVPTFNQLTGPYHEPFCLDIYISKGSVRASVVHRVTSKVVSVAHSISKDMKCNLASRKDYSACVAVGGILAQRAIADDIYNVVYAPSKGEKIEGKLKTVLQPLKRLELT